MTFKFVGALEGIAHPNPHVMIALVLGIGLGIVIEALRKIIKSRARLPGLGRRDRARGYVTDLGRSTARSCASPYASSFGGFVDFPRRRLVRRRQRGQLRRCRPTGPTRRSGRREEGSAGGHEHHLARRRRPDRRRLARRARARDLGTAAHGDVAAASSHADVTLSGSGRRRGARERPRIRRDRFRIGSPRRNFRESSFAGLDPPSQPEAVPGCSARAWCRWRRPHRAARHLSRKPDPAKAAGRARSHRCRDPDHFRRRVQPHLRRDLMTLRPRSKAILALALALAAPTVLRASVPPPPAPAALGPYIVLSWNDLGMHCMNQSTPTSRSCRPTTTSLPRSSGGATPRVGRRSSPAA